MADARRTYSLDEANALVPQLRSIVIQLAILRRRLDAAVESHGAFPEVGADDAPRGGAERREGEIEAMSEEVKAWVGHLDGLGVQVRDLELGLVDIPAERDGQPIWLCWRLSEPQVGFWHSTREGFANRRPW